MNLAQIDNQIIRETLENHTLPQVRRLRNILRDQINEQTLDIEKDKLYIKKIELGLDDLVEWLEKLGSQTYEKELKEFTTLINGTPANIIMTLMRVVGEIDKEILESGDTGDTDLVFHDNNVTSSYKTFLAEAVNKARINEAQEIFRKLDQIFWPGFPLSILSEDEREKWLQGSFSNYDLIKREHLRGEINSKM